jgi:uncharacterized membrane protein YhaH (DUF805 family)
MNIQQAIRTCFRKYVDFSGRASRSEYWWFLLAYFVVAVVAQLINRYLPAVVILAVLLPLLAATVRRLHDIGKSGWMSLRSLVPTLGVTQAPKAAEHSACF